MVWVQGAAHDAYLYDRIGANEPRYLDWDVSNVQWRMGPSGVERIDLYRYDGLTSAFDAYGNPYSGFATSSTGTEPLAPFQAAEIPSVNVGKAMEASSALKSASAPAVVW